jgi:hypothetical protein
VAKRTNRPLPADKTLSAAARRRRKSRRKYTLYYLLALILVLAAGCVLSMTVFFRIEAIEVRGNTRYADGELVDTAGISVGDNLLRINPADISRALIGKYPYIADVAVRRVLPVSVVLDITQATPVAAVETSSGHALIDERGRLLEDALPVRPEGWPRVVGFSIDDLAAGDYLDGDEAGRFSVLCGLIQAVAEVQCPQIVLMDLGDLLDLHLLYDGRVAIALGSSLDLAYKLRAAKNVIDTSVGADAVGSLDVSVRPVARLRELDIYSPEHWPFPIALLDDYERAIVRKIWQPPDPATDPPGQAAAQPPQEGAE